MFRTIQILGAALGGLVGITLTVANVGVFKDTPGGTALIVAWVLAWIVLGFSLLPYLTVVPATRLVRGVQALSTAEFVAAVIGLLLGLLMGLLLGSPLAGLPAPWGTWTPIGVSIALGLGMVGLTVAKRHDLLIAAEAIGLVRRPEQDPGHQRGDPHIVVDTSAVIDGRIAEIVDSGFLYGTLIVPRFVLDEVQRIADSPDTLRRNRGRRGLEILARLQKDSPTPVIVVDQDVPEVAEVDGKLVELAKRYSRAVLTNDFNLNRVARLEGVHVLNLNELANALKPIAIPGENLAVTVVKDGKEPNQGIGYLDDGTMVVIENGHRHLNATITVTVTSIHQTAAGRMIFASPQSDPRPASRRRARSAG